MRTLENEVCGVKSEVSGVKNEISGMRHLLGDLVSVLRHEYPNIGVASSSAPLKSEPSDPAMSTHGAGPSSVSTAPGYYARDQSAPHRKYSNGHDITQHPSGSAHLISVAALSPPQSQSARSGVSAESPQSPSEGTGSVLHGPSHHDHRHSHSLSLTTPSPRFPPGQGPGAGISPNGQPMVAVPAVEQLHPSQHAYDSTGSSAPPVGGPQQPPAYANGAPQQNPYPYDDSHHQSWEQHQREQQAQHHRQYQHVHPAERYHPPPSEYSPEGENGMAAGSCRTKCIDV